MAVTDVTDSGTGSVWAARTLANTGSSVILPWQEREMNVVSTRTPNQSLSAKMDILLLAIRVGPVAALMTALLFGWLRRTCSLLSSVASPYTARPVYLLGKLHQCVLWSTDAPSRLPALMCCLSMPWVCLWWIIPQTSRVREPEVTLCGKDRRPGRGSGAAGAACPKKKLVRRGSLTELVATLSFNCALLQMALKVVAHVPRVLARGASRRAWGSVWEPSLEAAGEVGRDMYAGLAPRHCRVLRRYNTRAALFTKLPWKGFSRMWGELHNLAFPKWLLYIGLRFYVWLFTCNVAEAEVQDLNAYDNLADFFRRKLRPGLRPIDHQHVLTSPADGRVLHLGPVHGGVLEQVKGVTYSMNGFLGSLHGLYIPRHSFVSAAASSPVTSSDELYVTALTSRPRQKLWQIIIYLGPGDYHHFHSPADWEVMNRRHFPGELFSVNPGIARWLQGLFNFNERVLYTGRWRHGFFSMTAVGATNVGSMSVKFDKGLKTNTKTEYERGSYFDETFTDARGRGRRVAKGELFGEFNLGSTIVLLFEAPDDFCFIGSQGRSLKYGQGIGQVRRARHRHGKARRKRESW